MPTQRPRVVPAYPASLTAHQVGPEPAGHLATAAIDDDPSDAASREPV